MIQSLARSALACAFSFVFSACGSSSSGGSTPATSASGNGGAGGGGATGGAAGTGASGASNGGKSGTGGSGAAGVAGAGAGGSAAGGAASTTVHVTGKVGDFMTNAPVASASLCVTIPTVMPTPCTTTATDGTYGLDVPYDTDFAVKFQASTYYDQIVFGHATLDVMLSLGPVTAVRLMMDAAASSATLDDTSGVFAINGGSAGLAFTISPPTSQPVYYDATGHPDPKATATSTAGLAVVFDVAPGTYEITETSGKTCLVTLGWKGSAPGALKAMVEAKTISTVGMTCF